MLAQTLLIATSALAANDNKGALKVSEPVTVNGTKLGIGDYKVNWEGTGADVEVNISKSNKVVATLPGHLVELDRPAHERERPILFLAGRWVPKDHLSMVFD